MDAHGGRHRVPVNVLSQDGSEVIFFRVDPMPGHPILNNLGQVASGFTPLPEGQRNAMNSLDFVRAPLFDRASGILLPPTEAGANNDLQDILEMYIEQLQAANGEIFVFGAKFPLPGQPLNPKPIDLEFDTHDGVHDIHMNQGNPKHSHDQDNGVFHDGGLILKFPNRFVGIFMKFQSQTWNVGPHGEALPGPAPDPNPVPIPGPDPGPTPTPPPTTTVAVYIERALVNPRGSDVGKEIVVLGNTTSDAVDLTGWSLVDHNNNAEALRGILIPAGESRSVVLSGDTAQLSNKGGTIRLVDPAGQIIHAVSYSKADAQNEGQFIRFNT